MSHVVLLTPDELQGIVKGAVSAALAEFTQHAQPHASAAPEKFLDVKEAASFLGISTQTLYTMAQNSEVPVTKVGRVYRFNPNELLAWQGGPSRMEIKNRKAQRKALRKK